MNLTSSNISTVSPCFTLATATWRIYNEICISTYLSTYLSHIYAYDTRAYNTYIYATAAAADTTQQQQQQQQQYIRIRTADSLYKQTPMCMLYILNNLLVLVYT